MNISSRLLSICDFVSDSKVYDVGCDHALLDIYLTLYKNCKCVCIDVDDKIINRAKSNILKYNLSDRIETFVGNGFNDLCLDNDSIMILSGMGSNTILKIVDKNRPNTIICQTNTEQYILRRGMCLYGYYISDESIVFDNNRYYITIKFSKGAREYSSTEYFLGPKLIKNNSSIFKDYVDNLYSKNIKAYNKSIEFNVDSPIIDLINAIKDYKGI